jgi:uncharacterized protein (DUF2267 family)
MPDTVVTDYDYEQFITTIQHKARVWWDEAELVARSTLETLAERLSAGEARDIARQLPGDLGKWLASSDDAQPFHADEFLRRVAEREGIDPETAESHARAVFIALGRVVSHQELEDMAAELPKDFLPLIAPAEAEADRLDPEVLAERIAGGDVDDLVAQLPADLRPALERGNERTGGKAQRMSLDELAELVGELEGVSTDHAREHAQAVIRTLREAISEKEFDDLFAELPDEFRSLLRGS